MKTFSNKGFLMGLLRVALFFLFLEMMLRLGGAVFVCVQDIKNRDNLYQPGVRRILCIGESMTLSVDGDSYPKQLENMLNLHHTQTQFKVINRGEAGSTTTTALNSLKSDLDRYNPDIVIVMVGVNDAKLLKITKERMLYLSLERIKVYNLFRQLIVRRFARQTERGGGEQAFSATSQNISKKIKPRFATYEESVDFQKGLQVPSVLTKYNYNSIAEFVLGQGKKLIVMQYPLVDIGHLKKIFSPRVGIVFVGNELNFRNAIENNGADQYFVDFFGVDFGHCTEKGNELIAENLDRVITEKLF